MAWIATPPSPERRKRGEGLKTGSNQGPLALLGIGSSMINMVRQQVGSLKTPRVQKGVPDSLGGMFLSDFSSLQIERHRLS